MVSSQKGLIPKYPIYVISKGRWESRKTSIALEQIGVPYRIVIEPQEYEQYSAVIDPSKILVLPFSNLGQGGIPARNWVWEHSISEGHKRHWILDDNIHRFLRIYNSKEVHVKDAAPFCFIEQETDKYENAVLTGMQYTAFGRQPMTKVWDKLVDINTRIYSCILIQNDLPFRWRGRYNEDTDLSLRVLKAGYCTLLFYVYLIKKETTMKMKGGNTDELYVKTDKFDGRLEMAKSLYLQHPDVVKITRKWGRWQHQVDYRPFKHNKLKPRTNGTTDEIQ